ncbi:MAG TPA: lipopolysaccharide heptosyltransferase II [Vicinamibacterales bacterium]|nr:lipopolysaccharide heptosyltransferase II [Vicinamibacterales bacterium]
MITGSIARLIVRVPNWLGDAVMALPALGAVRRAFEGRTVIVAAPAPVAPLFEERTPAAPDEILTLDRDREVEQLRAARGDALLLLTNSFGSGWAARRSGVPERWGYRASGRGLLLTRSVPRPKGTVHQIEYYLALARGLGLAVPEFAEARPRIQASPAARARADALLAAAGVEAGATLVGFAPGAAYGQAKRWPPARVAQVIAALSARGVTAVLVGARGDRPTARAIESTLPPGARLVDLIGRTSLRELVGVVARCAAFVSNDSGAMHVAAALGVPLTAIFGPTDERATAPAGHADVIVRDVFCRPCMLRDCPIDHRCMKRIDVESVLTSVSAHLAGGTPPAARPSPDRSA